MEPKTLYKLPLFLSSVEAGFPSPAEEYIEGTLDLNKLMIQHPAATFFVRASGDSMQDAAINPGDILVVDRALEASSGKIVLAVVNGEFTVKRLLKKGGKLYLVPENKRFSPLLITKEMDFQVWGVVTWVIHKA
ncbi:MAG: translesion error-prone DNA polymerase V autoproteolytic subunit [Chlamydiia bacterium]|nr:translesion error-prone DNA polymerase V autoproteolytic subunit [Chlamydiia bacterium]